MAKRYIGIDLDGETVRVALLNVEGGQVRLELLKRGYADAEEARQAIDDLTDGTRPLGDHLVSVIPARDGFIRSLNFPFKERSKLSAVLAAELESQVPVGLGQYSCAMLPPREQSDGTYQVGAAAVRNDTIEGLLAHFPDPFQQPRRLGLVPHALAGGLGEVDGLLVCCSRLETVVALLQAGEVEEFRLLPTGDGLTEADICAFLLAQLPLLQHRSGRADLPVWVCGAAASDEVLQTLDAEGYPQSVPTFPFAAEVPREFLPAVLLAQAERLGGRHGGFNFRSGPYAPRGQLELMKKKLAAAVVLLLLCGLALGGNSYFAYQRKAEQAELLKQQLEERFRQTLPAAKVIVDVPLQLRSHLQELQQQALLLGVGNQGTALGALESLSRLLPPEMKVDVQELSYNGELLRLDGYTDSFDSVNRISQVLGNSPRFRSIEISEAKMTADGGRVDFQLQIELQSLGEDL